MKRILVTYASMAGSTAEVAQAIAEEITQDGWQVETKPIGEVTEIGNYDGVVLGAPMIMGWHRGALRFLRKHRRAFQQTPVAIFLTAMKVTQGMNGVAQSVPVYIDEKLPTAPKDANKLTFRERYARLENYLRPILAATRPTKPVSIGVFGGRLEYGRLKWWAVLFAMVIVQATAGDKRNWPAIQEWAGRLPRLFAQEIGSA